MQGLTQLFQWAQMNGGMSGDHENIDVDKLEKLTPELMDALFPSAAKTLSPLLEQASATNSDTATRIEALQGEPFRLFRLSRFSAH